MKRLRGWFQYVALFQATLSLLIACKNKISSHFNPVNHGNPFPSSLNGKSSHFFITMEQILWYPKKAFVFFPVRASRTAKHSTKVHHLLSSVISSATITPTLHFREVSYLFFSNFHFNNISTNYNYTSHYRRQCTIGCHSGTKVNIINQAY